MPLFFCLPTLVQSFWRCRTPPGPREGLNPLAFLNIFPSLYAAGLWAIGMTAHGGNMKQLPEFPDLSHLKKQAKQLLRDYRALQN